METTMDRLGRIVVPKKIRDALGLSEGGSIEITEANGEITIRAASVEKRLVSDGRGGLVCTTEETVPTLTADEVRNALEATRR
jgi:AbrB family looped-hinge helix DNA binding protein